MPGPRHRNNDTEPLAIPLVLAAEEVQYLRGLIATATDPSQPQDRRTLNAFRVVGQMEAVIARHDRERGR